jgi:ATP-binding protein involved in chromosome partitioning
MFRKVNVPVLGIVENMSYYICGHCGERTEIFGHGGGKKTAEMLGVPFLGEVPIDPQVVVGGDTGQPIVVAHPESAAAQAFREIAAKIVQQIESGHVGHTHDVHEHAQIH